MFPKYTFFVSFIIFESKSGIAIATNGFTSFGIYVGTLMLTPVHGLTQWIVNKMDYLKDYPENKKEKKRKKKEYGTFCS